MSHPGFCILQKFWMTHNLLHLSNDHFLSLAITINFQL